MKIGGLVGSTPIDDFLAGAGDASEGERWETVGAGLGLAGTVLALGVLSLLVLVHRGRQSEIRSLLRLAMAGGALMFVGGGVEVAGTAQVLDVGWIDALTDGAASGAMLRLLGGLLLVLGLGSETAPVESALPDGSGDPGTAPGTHRWVMGASSAFGAVGAMLGPLSFTFDGHTVTEGPRVIHAAVNVVHVTAAGVWAGGIVGLAVLGALRRRHGGGSVASLIVRFSSVATVSLAAVVIAGVVMGWIVLDGFADLTSTEWGRTLLIKTGAVAAIASLGAYNHLLLVPRLAAGDLSAARTARATITVEAVLFVAVVALTAALTRASPT